MLTPQDLINIIEMFFESNNLDFEDFKNELIKQAEEYEKIEMTFEEVLMERMLNVCLLKALTELTWD